ncbi:MAG: hydrolase [Gammaproteobacteria bacterium]|nr:hydrolase [Gammaproteobacteria bacterium]
MITRSAFRPAWWLPGPHLQTLYPALFRKRKAPRLTRERFELVDGDFLDIDWTRHTGGMRVLILHGLEGSLDSHYTGGLLHALQQSGYTAGLMYFRGRSGEPNRLSRSYHSGDTADLEEIMQRISQQQTGTGIAVVGFSLGGNVLLKWLGEKGQSAGIVTAIAISVPLNLHHAALKLDRGLSRIYQRHLLQKLRESVTAKAVLHSPPFPLDRLRELSTFRKFDNEITAPLHGFRDVDDYYARSSSKQFLKNIQIPTLLLQAIDDPFLPASALPTNDELSAFVTMELSKRGGHVGFVSGSNPLQPHYWLEERILQHLNEHG